MAIERRIAILGWGSLLWEGGAEFERWIGNWRDDGPSLKLEFSRISESRLGALTLVIDGTNGAATTVAWCLSVRKTIADAATDLRCRERCAVRDIRSMELPLATGGRLSSEETQVAAWAQARDLNAVVWTSLPSNFEKKTASPFSVAAAINYLKHLPPEAKAKAAEYIWRAPKFVATPLRSAMEHETWAPPSGSGPVRDIVDSRHVALHRYWMWADALRTGFNEWLKASPPKADGLIEMFTPGFAYMSYWYSALDVVVEGWRELALHDTKIDSLLASTNTALLHRYRNAACHFQPQLSTEGWPASWM
jgi:hypothetical protein